MWESQAVLWSDFSKRLWEATFFVAFHSRGISTDGPLPRYALSGTPGSETVKKFCGAKPLRSFSAHLSYKRFSRHRPIVLIGKVGAVSY